MTMTNPLRRRGGGGSSVNHSASSDDGHTNKKRQSGGQHSTSCNCRRFSIKFRVATTIVVFLFTASYFLQKVEDVIKRIHVMDISSASYGAVSTMMAVYKERERDNRTSNDVFSSIPIYTDTLTRKPSRYTDGLEFLHITKTAGTSIEVAAARAGINYGACHWAKQLGSSQGPACNEPDKEGGLRYNATRIPKEWWFAMKSHAYWHAPSHWFHDEDNPYLNKSVFVVVRNPYTRLVSEFFYFCQVTKNLCNDTTSATMNEFIREQSWKCARRKDCRAFHFFPQHAYVYDKEGNQVVDHILRFEHLNEDFLALISLYDLPIGLPTKTMARNEGGKAGGSYALTVANLTKATLKVINEVYDKDFSRLHYLKVTSPQEFLM